MSQSSRQFKLTAKIQPKSQHKSSLPNIDPLHHTKSKFVTPSPVKPAFKNVRKISRNNQPASNINNGQLNGQNYEKKVQNNENELHNNQKRIMSKESSVQVQKQLNTATTIHIEEGISFKENDIKETQIKGLDMWALNKNLKQFSQTRKVAFFKPTIKNETSSTITKNKTQEIKSMYKIYGGTTETIGDPQKEKSFTDRKIKKINQHIIKRKNPQVQPNPYSTFSKNKIHSALEHTLYGTLPVRRQASNLNNTLYTKEKKVVSQHKIKDYETVPADINPYLRTFINGSHLKREPSSKKLEILQLKNFTPKATQNVNTERKINEKKSNNFRRNRFEKILTEQNSTSEKSKILNKEESISIVQQKQKQNKAENEDLLFTFKENRQSESLQRAIRDDKERQAQEKKRQYEYNRSIQKVNKSLLKNIDNYMDNYQTFSAIPSSKIQFFIDSLNHPQISNNSNNEDKSTYQIQDFSEFKDEFSFIETIKSKANLKSKNSHINKNKQVKRQKGGYKN